MNSPGNYAYLNARLRAGISGFFGRKSFTRLASGTLQDLEVFLLESSYGKTFRRELVQNPHSVYQRIETALALGASDKLQKARNMAQGEPEVLFEVLLSRADLHNSRLLIRSFDQEGFRGPEPLWHGYGTLSRDFYHSLWICEGFQEIMDHCFANGHAVARALAASFSDIEIAGNVVRAERKFLSLFLDYFTKLLKKGRGSNARLVAEYLGRVVDIWNINIWRRTETGKVDMAEASGAFLPGGAHIEQKRLMQTKSIEDLLAGTPWSAIFGKNRVTGPADFQRKLSDTFTLWQCSMLRKNPLGIEVAMGYAARQILEWNNLHITSVGIAMGFSASDIMLRLTFPGEGDRS